LPSLLNYAIAFCILTRKTKPQNQSKVRGDQNPARRW